MNVGHFGQTFGKYLLLAAIVPAKKLPAAPPNMDLPALPWQGL
jgi:hypothetical protein